jgi:hypothetical protein
MSITEGNFQIFYQIFNHQECIRKIINSLPLRRNYYYNIIIIIIIILFNIILRAGERAGEHAGKRV